MAFPVIKSAHRLALAIVLGLTAIRAFAAVPENDSFAARIPLFGSNVSASGNNIDASKEPGEPDPSFAGGKSVWWTWVAPADGYLSATTSGSSFDTMLTVFTGNILTNLSLVAFNDVETNTSSIGFNVTAGTIYQIAVDGAQNATGSISLQLSLGPVQPPPANDNFSDRVTLSGTHLVNVPGSNLGATAEPDEPFHADTIGLKSVWWTWTAPASGGVTLTTQGSSIDTVLAVYTGNSIPSLTLVTANDEDPLSSFGYESRVTFNAVSNVTYQIAVDGFEGDAGDIRLRLDLDAAFPVATNDNFANRKIITGSTISTNGSNVGATYEPNEPMHLVTFGGKSVWYSWTAPASGGVTLTASNNLLDTILCVYRGTSLTNLTFVAGNDEDFLTDVPYDSTAYFNVTNGTTYQIVVDGYDGSSGNFNLRLVLGLADAAPANDNFANRITVTGTNTTKTGSNIGATFQVDEPLHHGYYGGKSVWYQWTAPAAGYVTVDTIGSLCDTLLAVYTGNALSNLVEVASDDESGGNYTSLVTFATKSNVTYQIAVDGFDGDGYDISMRVRFGQASYTLTVATNPSSAGTISISSPPDQGSTYSPGSVVTLTATPSGPNLFTGWTGNITSTNNPLVVTMNSNKTITATFLVIPTTKVWTGGSNPSGNWSASQNWNGGTPSPGDDLIFPPGALRLASNTNDLPVNTPFKSITFGAADYVLRGNAVALTNGIVCTNTTGTNTVSFNIQLALDQSFACTNPSANLLIISNIALGSRTLTADANGGLTLSGVISGSGNIIKSRFGTLSFSGNNTNTFTGTTTVNEGTLDLAKTGIAIPGSLIIGDGAGPATSHVVRFRSNLQLSSSSPVTINNGLLDLNNFSGAIGSLSITGGDVTTGSGTLSLNGNVTANAAATVANITGSLSLQGTTRTFVVADGAASPDLLLTSTIIDGTGSAGITKTGAGRLQLAGSNTYSGPTIINQGILHLSHPFALGATNQGTTLNSNATLIVSGNLSAEALALAGGTLASETGSNSVPGIITLSNLSLIAPATNSILNLSGVVTGAANLVKIGDGTLIFSGPSANSYSGSTTVNQGTLLLSKSSSNAIPAALIIGDGTGGANADVVRCTANSQISPSAAVTLNSSGLLNLNNFTGSLASLTMTGGNVASGSGSLRLNGNVTANASTSPATISGILLLEGAKRTFNVADGAAALDLSISALIADGSGTGGIIKNGVGKIQLSGTNTFSGLTTINQGILDAASNAALGNTNAGTVVNSNAVLLINALTLNEGLSLAGGALQSDSGNHLCLADVALANSSLFNIATNSTLTLSGILNGPGNTIKLGPGTLILSGSSPNTSSGATLVNEGSLQLSKTTSNAVAGPLILGDGTGAPGSDIVSLNANQQISIASTVTIGSSGLLQLTSFSNAVASLTGSGHVNLGSPPASLSLGNNGASAPFDGLISGAGTLVKNGAGLVTLNGNNSYTGPTYLNAGTLVINGNQSDSPVFVAASASLAGSGQVGDLSSLGTISPGSSPGAISCGNFSQASNSVLNIQLDGPLPATGYDQLDVNGTVTLSGQLNLTMSFSPDPNSTFTIINNDGSDPVTGMFNDLPEGATLAVNGMPFQITYIGGLDGNDVILTRMATPTPSISLITLGANPIIHVAGSPGLVYILEAADNLAESPWIPLNTNTADSNGLCPLTDPDPPSFPSRFYRVRWAP